MTAGNGPLGRRAQFAVKHALDRLVGVALGILLAPVLAVIGGVVRMLDGPPVFFRQPRAGRGEKVFVMWKFRTMKVDADRLLDATGKPTTNRLTRTGRFLRATSLDELPNLFNIVMGDMSLVGPRPTLPELRERYGIDDDTRFRVKPGVTGLAQVSGRNSIPWAERLRLDAEYVDRFSLALDARILARTVKVALLREGVQLDRNPEANYSGAVSKHS